MLRHARLHIACCMTSSRAMPCWACFAMPSHARHAAFYTLKLGCPVPVSADVLCHACGQKKNLHAAHCTLHLTLCHAMPCYAMLCCAVLCCAVLCYATVCCAMFWYATRLCSVLQAKPVHISCSAAKEKPSAHLSPSLDASPASSVAACVGVLPDLNSSSCNSLHTVSSGSAIPWVRNDFAAAR